MPVLLPVLLRQSRRQAEQRTQARHDVGNEEAESGPVRSCRRRRPPPPRSDGIQIRPVQQVQEQLVRRQGGRRQGGQPVWRVIVVVNLLALGDGRQVIGHVGHVRVRRVEGQAGLVRDGHHAGDGIERPGRHGRGEEGGAAARLLPAPAGVGVAAPAVAAALG